MKVNRDEARRYLGLHQSAGQTDARLAQLLDAAADAVEQAATPRAVWCRQPLQLMEDGVVLAHLHIPGRSLRTHLDGCTQACLLAATLGAGTDRLLGRTALTDVSAAAAQHACAAALLETYCDVRARAIGEEVAAEGLFLRPRFSPGYGDFPIAFQQSILDVLQAQTRIGLMSTAAMMLTPVKSITAVIGLAPTEGCAAAGCGSCGKTDCYARRADE